MQPDNIKFLFEPKTVAVVGASHDPDKVGYKILENIIDGKFKGKIFPVNPKGGEVLGLPVFKKIVDIAETIDVAIICIPAGLVYEEIKNWPAGKIKYLIVVSSGFSEIGNIEEEKKIVSIAKERGIRILGPNVFGLYSSKSSLTATFGAKVKIKGNLAIVSQSGALGIALMGKTETEGIGLSAIIFEGNKADLNEKDLLPYFLADEQTKAIFLYMEGVKDGRHLIPVLKGLTAKKPVVVLKAGTSAKGAAAAVSHTGSMAGESRVFKSIMKQCGVIQAQTLEEAIAWSGFLVNTPVPKGENVMIITNGGGMGILATDECEKYRLSLYGDKTDLQANFCTVIPDFGSCKNPVDITGQAKAEDYKNILEIALNDPAVDSVICLGCEIAVLDNQKLAEVFADIYGKFQKAGKPITFAFVGGKEVEEKMLSLKNRNIPIFNETHLAVSCLGALYAHYHNLNRRADESSCDSFVCSPEALEIMVKVRKEGRNFLSPQEAGQLMEQLEIPQPKSLIASDGKQAVEMSEKIGYPVAMKVVSEDIVHKTEAGGVILNIFNQDQTESAFGEIIERAKKYNSVAQIKGVEISEMVNGGIEVIVGAKKDYDFGTIVMVGLGGIYTETLRDISFRAFPITLSEAEQMVKDLRSSPLFWGVRNQKTKDIKSLTKLMLRLGAIVDSCPEISEIEINPLKVFEKGRGVKALDVRVLVF